MSSIWRNLHARTQEWAIEANEEWLASLSPDAASGARRDPEAKVVLFGPTQVGKTTLLLSLLGIRDAAAADVESVLRGGRVHGQSSTALPMRYLRSRDDLWRMEAPDAPGSSAEEVRAHLGAIRAAVENGRHQGTDPVTLYIPAGHFSTREPAVRVSVLDLPGIAAAAPRERALVERIARRHLPAAGLILLVGQASKLGMLDPEELGKQLEELKGWTRSRLRYRLVLTYTFDQESMERRFRSLPDLAAVRAHFVEQIGLFNYPVDASLGERLYPLDFGRSWSDRLATEGAYRDWAVKVRTQGLSALREDIARSCEGDTRLRISQEVREQTLWRAEVLRHERTEAVRTARRDLHRRRERVRIARRAIARWERRLQDATTALRKLDAALAQIDRIVEARMTRSAIAAKSHPDKQTTLLNAENKPVSAHVDALAAWLLADRAALAGACDRIVDGLNRKTGLRLRALEVRCVAELRQEPDHLGEQLGEGRYWTWLSRRFAEDSRKLLEDAEERRRLIATTLPTQLRDQALPDRDRLVRRWRQVARRCESLGKLSRRLEGDLASSRVQHGRILAELRRKRMVLGDDQVRVDGFDAQMARAVAVESLRIGDTIGAAARDGEAAVLLASLCSLRLTRNAHRLICPESA